MPGSLGHEDQNAQTFASWVTELEIEIYTILNELTSSISIANLEHVRRLKSHLLALTYRVQKVRDEIEQLMDDDGDKSEMYLTHKKERVEAYLSTDQYLSCQPATGIQDLHLFR